MIFALHASAKEYIDDMYAVLKAERERREHEEEEARNRAEVVSLFMICIERAGETHYRDDCDEGIV